MTTLFVSTTGGHLSELLRLTGQISGGDRAVWVTHDNAQARSALAGRDVEYVPFVAPRNLLHVLRCLPSAHRLLRTRGITRAVSTGSGIALGYLPYLAMRGVECHFVESTTRVDGPSLTGRVLARLPRVNTYSRYRPGTRREWPAARWCYAGNDLDGFRAVPVPRVPVGRLRVVVMVGTCGDFGFERMLRPLSALLAPGGPLERTAGMGVDVLWQTAGLPVAHLGIDATPFLPSDDLDAAVAAADIVVCHAGVGCATGSLRAGRLPVLVARAGRYGEASDDHQWEFAAELERRGLACHVDPASLTAGDLLATLQHTVVAVPAPATPLARL